MKLDILRFENSFRFDYEGLFALYPRVQKKKISITLLQEKISSHEDYARLKIAIVNYREYCKGERVEFKYILTFPRFFEEWEDWLDPLAGKSLIASDKWERLK